MGAQYGWPQFVLQETVNAFLQLQAALESTQGISIGIADFGGFRSSDDTATILGYRNTDFEQAVAAGEIPASTDPNAWRPIAPYGHSFHDFGAAFDIRIKSGGVPAGMTAEQAMAIAGSLAPSFGLRWGGSFADPDVDHFELDVSLSQARSMFANEYATQATIVAGDVSNMDISGLGADDVGDDAGMSDLQLELAAQENTIGWVVAAAALVSALAILWSRR